MLKLKFQYFGHLRRRVNSLEKTLMLGKIEGMWTVAHQAPLFMGFSRQEYWSGLSCPLPGDLPDSGIEPTSLASPVLAVRFIYHYVTREAPTG